MKETMEVESMEWLKHPVINRGWISEQLYGKSDASTSSKLSKKINGKAGKAWLPEELEKLRKIRVQLFNHFRPHPNYSGD